MVGIANPDQRKYSDSNFIGYSLQTISYGMKVGLITNSFSSIAQRRNWPHEP